MPKTLDPMDKLVGQNIRIHRLARGISQEELGRRLGVTFQQIQKYEKGTNRVGSGRLARVAEVLEVPLANFFAGASDQPSPSEGNSGITDMLAEPYAVRLLMAFSKLPDREVRRSLVSLVESMARGG